MKALYYPITRSGPMNNAPDLAREVESVLEPLVIPLPYGSG